MAKTQFRTAATSNGITRTWADTHGTREALMARLAYDPGTGVFTWRNRSGDEPRVRGWNTRYAGRVAGTPNKDGYVQINVAGRILYAHRLAWLFQSGEWPEEIDHINGAPGDNRIVNLRAASRVQNLGNRKRLSTNKVGRRGVCFDRRANKYRAAIVVDGKQKHLGYFASADEAAAVYAAEACKRFGEFMRAE